MSVNRKPATRKSHVCFSNIECIFTTIERCSLIQNADKFIKGMTRKLHNMRKGQQWISFHKIVSIKTYCLEFSSSTISCQKEPFWSVLNIIVISYANLLEARTSHESMATILPRLARVTPLIAWGMSFCRLRSFVIKSLFKQSTWSLFIDVLQSC